MALKSDLQLQLPRFDPSSIDAKTAAMNEKIRELTVNGPSWTEVGAARYRQMRLEGNTPLPKPTVLEAGRSIEIQSRESGRTIPCRLFYPSDKNGEQKPKTKGVVMHIHGGGWVLMSHETSDPLLQFYADTADCAVISVGYRLAPEHPFPAGPHDCFDVGEYLAKNAVEEFGGPLRFIGGESAGGHLSLLAFYHLMHTIPDFSLHGGGLLLHFGAFDLSFLPQARSFPHPLVLNLKAMQNFMHAFVPSYVPALPSISTPMNSEGLAHPSISPFYEDLDKWRGRLPRVLFTCGSMDCLLEDSVMMAGKWAMAGGDQVLRVVEGGVHGYIGFKPDLYPPAKVGIDVSRQFIQEQMSNV